MVYAQAGALTVNDELFYGKGVPKLGESLSRKQAQKAGDQHRPPSTC